MKYPWLNLVSLSLSRYSGGSVRKDCFLAQTGMTVSYTGQHKHLKIIIHFLPMRLSCQKLGLLNTDTLQPRIKTRRVLWWYQKLGRRYRTGLANAALVLPAAEPRPGWAWSLVSASTPGNVSKLESNPLSSNPHQTGQYGVFTSKASSRIHYFWPS